MCSQAVAGVMSLSSAMKTRAFYASQGMNDYAHITDFDPTQDQLQLNGDSNYFTAQVEHPDVTGTGVFRSADGPIQAMS